MSTGPAESNAKLLYIMGTARSASTILEVVLANSPGIVGAGELGLIFQDGFVESKPCSCGEGLADCPQWRRVHAAFTGEEDPQELAELLRRFDWHRGFPARLMGRRGVDSGRYREVNRRLLGALGSEGQWIVDSSKYAGRALALDQAGIAELRCVCLTRSPRGLLHAFTKKHRDEQKPKGLLGIVAYYLAVTVCLRLAAWRLGQRVLFVAYEDLLDRPVETLRRIESWCGLDLSESIRRVAREEWLETGHIVTGNRLRKERRIRFRRRGESLAPMTRSQGLAVSLMNCIGRLLGFREVAS